MPMHQRALEPYERANVIGIGDPTFPLAGSRPCPLWVISGHRRPSARVRFTPKSGHELGAVGCPLSESRHQPKSARSHALRYCGPGCPRTIAALWRPCSKQVLRAHRLSQASRKPASKASPPPVRSTISTWCALQKKR